ncbi:MAG TPA: protein phosphatase 2C domain-containing protein [Gemmataceae bacterium]|nr:protein phosphatase 2C domain-containing protein [Gemmataceae bacterium]
MTRRSPPASCQALSLPKRGNAADEYEDAFAADSPAGRFAVADGASESSFAGLWARLLVEGFVRPAPGWLDAARRSWAAGVGGQPLPWYAEAKRDDGAFATLLGLVVGDGRWHALAVGDSCLFQVRQDRLIEAFPLRRSAEFGNRPLLIGSRPPVAPASEVRAEGRGGWQPADRFLLMTDALAQWFLRRHEAGDRPWEELTRLPTKPDASDAFATWVEERRRHDGLRNDDVTLVLVGV